MPARSPLRPAPRLLAAAALAVLALAAACSGSSSPAATGSTTTAAKGSATTVVTTTSTTAAGGSTGAHACSQGATEAHVAAAVVAGTPSDHDMTSFDGTTIRIHWFPASGASAAHPDPTILMGPGWSLAGDTLAHPPLAFGALGIADMNTHGFNVLTWDPRGFGQSGGKAEVDSPRYEGRDVQVMIDWVSEQPGVQLDRPGDPRMGMVGYSYGGGIQLTVASIDCRVDALVPGLAWHSLGTSLFKADTVKAGWSKILTTLVDPTHLDPHIVSASKSGLATGTLSAADHQWFLDRGPGDAGIAKIKVPTLLVSGTVDTLFTLDEAIENYRILRADGVPTAMLWFCGGHGTCLTKPGDQTRTTRASYAWLDHYLKGAPASAIGPRLDLVDQDGVRWTAADYPVADATPVTASGHGTLALTAASQAGPLPAGHGGSDLLSSLVGPVTPAKAAVAVGVSVDPGSVDGLALGAPTLKLTYTGTTPDPATQDAVMAARPERVFAQLVDDTLGVVVDNQITPIDVTLDGKAHTTTVPLEVIAQHLSPGHTLTLQLVATTPAYATPRLGGSITFSSIHLSIPVAKPSAATRH